jgi:hypothetical protein
MRSELEYLHKLPAPIYQLDISRYLKLYALVRCFIIVVVVVVVVVVVLIRLA